MSAHQQILEWANGQPLWRRDALRRFLTGAFGPEDEKEILELLKADAKLFETKLKAKPLLAEHLPTIGSGTDALTLASLAQLTNTNRLAPDQRLTFGATGVTLVYGDNGSGKSGYARVFKKACRARLVESILNDVFDAKAVKKPATAEFEIIVGGGASKTVKWEDGKVSPSELARIAVFDSKCASVYVDKDNQVTFIPYNLDCFERLARLCEKFKELLTAEQRALAAATSTPVIALPEGTATYAFLTALAVKTDDELEKATAWTEGDEARLVELSKLITDPEKRAIALRQIQADLKLVRSLIADAAPHLSAAAVAALKAKKAAMLAAKQAVQLAATEAFSKEPIPGAGTSPWRALYEAAKAYSEQEAYKGRAYPPLDADDRCVLCQQTLTDEAKGRMQRFEAFVRGEVTQKADAALKEWDAAVAAFRNATVKLAPMSPTFDKALKSESDALHTAIAAYISTAIKARDQIDKAVIGDAEVALDAMPTIALADIDAGVGELDKAAAAAEAAAKDEAAIKLRKELAELQARKQLHLNKAQVVKRLNDLRTLKKLETAIKACVTTGISQKGTELLKEHVTGAFDAALVAERAALGIQAIPLRLVSRSAKGTPTHQLKLDGTTYAGNTSDIVSEGEHRALALAAFFAEQSMVPGNAPIIVDDPVSSLDHTRRHLVAHRLVQEGKKRQVVVFTHDLLLYMDASFIAAEKQVPLTKIGIRHGPNGFGTVDPDGDPWTAKTLSRRQAWLEQQHARLKKLYEAEGATEGYEKEVHFFYDRLRETWERVIEEGLFANVVVRFRRGLETKRLAEAVITDEIFVSIYRGMTAVSAYTGHDKPVAAGASPPDPALMRQHLIDLIACLGVIKAESAIVTKRREKLEKAPAPVPPPKPAILNGAAKAAPKSPAN